jgi:hypothetical protein
MLTITSTRIKKALLHPGAALNYFKNYLKGEIIRINSKKELSSKIVKSLKYREWEIEDLIKNAIEEPFISSEVPPQAGRARKKVLPSEARQVLIIESAKRILNNEFSFLGITTKPLKKINWHQDLKSSHLWPSDFYLDLREKLTKDYNKGWDIKYVWELSRFHYLIPLALAFYKTGEEKYFDKWQELIIDWIKNNPVYYGPNWINAMEVAIRASNWILSFEIIKKKLQDTKFKIQNTFLEKFLGSLFEHGRFIFNNLEYAPTRSNHYLSDIVGLIHISFFLEGNQKIKKWQKFTVQALEKEMDFQVLNDGVDYELSVSYHRYKTELFLWATYVLKINKSLPPISRQNLFSRLLRHRQSFARNKINLSNEFWLKLGKMMNFVLAIIKPNGLAPQIGDSDDSRLYLVWENYFSWEKRKYDSLIKLFSLTSGKQIENYPLNSAFFPKGGIYILKDNNFYLITGRHKACYGKGGSHTHNDILSLEFSMLGEDLIIDPGTYVYTSDYKERNKFRSTRTHNVALLDNQEQNPLIDDPFYFEQRAQMTVKKWEEQKDFILFEAEHDGYKYLRQPVIYQRSLLWHKQNKSLSITDKFIGEGHHGLEWNFHLAADIKIWMKNNKNNSREMILISKSNSFLFQAPKKLNCAIIEDEVSPSYGIKIPSKTLRFSGFLNKDSQKEFQFKIEPIH